jgi:hydrogenase nickel incorporation protein HypA/HybF
MHELSIVASILDIAEKTSAENHQSDVLEIELEIGELAGVDMHAFDFAWNTSITNTILAKAKKTIHQPKGKARCLECERDFFIKAVYDACPYCHQYFNKVLGGQELKVVSLTLN